MELCYRLVHSFNTFLTKPTVLYIDPLARLTQLSEMLHTSLNWQVPLRLLEGDQWTNHGISEVRVYKNV